MYLATEPVKVSFIEQALPTIITGVIVTVIGGVILLVIKLVIQPKIDSRKLQKRKKIILQTMYKDTVRNLLQARNLLNAAKNYRTDTEAQHIVHTHSGFSLSKDIYVCVIEDTELVESIGPRLSTWVSAIRLTIDAAMGRYPDFVKNTQKDLACRNYDVINAFAKSLGEVEQHSEMVLHYIPKECHTARV